MYIKAPEEGFEAEINVMLQMIHIDELGATYKCNHLLSKGSVFYIDSADIKDIFSSDKRILMTVVNNEVISDTEGYKMYAEFDNLSDEQSTALRKWISEQKIIRVNPGS